MRIADRIGQCSDPLHGLPRRRQLFLRGDGCRQRATRTILRGHPRQHTRFADFINRDDMRMIERCRGMSFLQKAVPQFGRENGFGPLNLQCHMPSQQRIKSQVDDAKAAAPKFSNNLKPDHAIRQRVIGLPRRGARPHLV
jgi:hypothetical protein